jgi:hypothetical protein
VGVLVGSTLFAAACSPEPAPEAGNQLDTAPPQTAAITAVASSSVAPSSAPAGPSATSTTVPVFIPPSTTLPDDPDLREAIRVRVAVEAEYRRQLRAGTADAAGFEGLADPNTWLPQAIRALEESRDAGAVVQEGSVSGVTVASATRTNPTQILLDTCVFDDDVETTGTETSGGLDLGHRTSVMVRKGGSWLYQGSVVLDSPC